MKIIAQNKKATHEYFILDKYECGLVLTGTEIKSIRAGKVNIEDAYVTIKNSEAFIINMHVSPYSHGNLFNHQETRTRKLLLHKQEIRRLIGKTKEDGHTLIPLKIYLNQGLAKLEIGLAKGKKLHDKRDALKEKDMKRQVEKTLKHY